jgi:hypothetical protein
MTPLSFLEWFFVASIIVGLKLKTLSVRSLGYWKILDSFCRTGGCIAQPIRNVHSITFGWNHVIIKLGGGILTLSTFEEVRLLYIRSKNIDLVFMLVGAQLAMEWIFTDH